MIFSTLFGSILKLFAIICDKISRLALDRTSIQKHACV